VKVGGVPQKAIEFDFWFEFTELILIAKTEMWARSPFQDNGTYYYLGIPESAEVSTAPVHL
jgi:hypothetical protein